MGACANLKDEFAKKNKNNRCLLVFCLVEVVFLLFAALFAVIGLSTLRGASPQVWTSKAECGKVAGEMSNKCGTSEEDKGTCFAAGEPVPKQVCPTDVALKGCRVYSSNKEVFDKSYTAKAEVKVGTVSAKLVEFGKQSTKMDKMCGFTDECKPVTSLLRLDDAPKKPVPEPLIWLLYKLIGLAPAIFEILFLMCLCSTEDQTLGVFQEITAFGSGFWWFLAEDGCIRKCITHLQYPLKYLKFKMMPNLLFAEIAGMQGHPTCDGMAVSRMVPNAVEAAYLGLFIYTFTSILVYIVYVKCRAEALLTEKKVLNIKKGDWRESNGGGLLEKLFLVPAMCFMAFLDMAGILLIIIYYGNVLSDMEGVLGFNFEIGFAFNIGIAITLDLFQLTFLGLSMVETAHFFWEYGGYLRDALGCCCGSSEGDDEKTAC